MRWKNKAFNSKVIFKRIGALVFFLFSFYEYRKGTPIKLHLGQEEGGSVMFASEYPSLSQ